MTPQRKTLLAVVAMLFCANAVALAVMNHKPAEVLWFGGVVNEIWPPLVEGAAIPQSPEIVVLDRNGASLDGERVPFTAIIDNVGRTAFETEMRNCDDGCAPGPWRAQAIATAETPMSVLVEAVRTVRAQCNVEVVIFAGAGTGMPRNFGNLMLVDRWDAAQVPIPMSHSFDPTVMYIREDETLEQFGERTGCARVSPLRP